MRPNRSALILVTTLVVVACGSRSEAPAPTSTPPAQVASPRASATPPAGASEAPSKTPVPPSSVPRVTWTRLGDASDLSSLLPWWFSEGYLAMGGVPSDPEDDWGVWFSSDGRTWDVSPMSTTITPCPGWVPRASTTGAVGWAAGGGAVILGLEHIPGGEPCGEERIVAWRSSDGRDWTRSSDFESTDLLGYPVAVWAVGDRWEAAVSERTGATTIWSSAGGERWERVATISEAEGADFGPVLVGADGRRVAEFRGGDSDANGLIASTDGKSWQPLEGLPLDVTDHESWFLSSILAPNGAVPFWLVTAEIEGDRLRTIVLTSRDLVSWEKATFPMPVIVSAVHTPDGTIAVGADPCRDTGTACPDVPPVSYISRDGLSWEPISAPTGPTSFAEGPSGVIGLGDGSTWTLTRYTDEQAFLLDGVRADARAACTVRDDLPAGAVAGIECAPSGGPADRVGAYLFPSEETMLSAYFSRLAEEGISPESGGCPGTPGDAAYVPTAGDPASEPHRTGCFVNEFGVANYRVTYPEAHVYVGVLGRDRDLATLGAWVWEGDLGTPGSPSIWREGQTAAGS